VPVIISETLHVLDTDRLLATHKPASASTFSLGSLYRVSL
jgi:hypothetical protein